MKAEKQSDKELEHIEWVEKAALENIKAHIQAADELKKECNVALAVLLAGAGGALAYAARAFESASTQDIAFAALALSLSLFALCGTILYYCLWVRDIPAPTNEPRNLMIRDADFRSLRIKELNTSQKKIEAASARNKSTAYWLNRIRVLALLTPLVPFATLLVIAAARAF